MSRFLSLSDRVLEGVIVLLMIGIVLVISADVVARYCLGGSLVFANELSRMCFIWICFLGMPLCIGKGLNVAITSLESRLSASLQILMFRAGVLMVIVLMGTVAYGAWVSIEARSAERLNTIPVNAAWFFFPVLIGALYSIVHLISEFLRGARTVRQAIEMDTI